MSIDRATVRQRAQIAKHLRSFVAADPSNTEVIAALQAEVAALLTEIDGRSNSSASELRHARTRAMHEGRRSEILAHRETIIGDLRRWEAEGVLPKDIAARLNARGSRTFTGREWTAGTVHNVLKERA